MVIALSFSFCFSFDNRPSGCHQSCDIRCFGHFSNQWDRCSAGDSIGLARLCSDDLRAAHHSDVYPHVGIYGVSGITGSLFSAIAKWTDKIKGALGLLLLSQVRLLVPFLAPVQRLQPRLGKSARPPCRRRGTRRKWLAVLPLFRALLPC